MGPFDELARIHATDQHQATAQQSEAAAEALAAGLVAFYGRLRCANVPRGLAADLTRAHQAYTWQWAAVHAPGREE